MIAACVSVNSQEERCSLITKRPGKFAQDTGLVGNIYDDAMIKKLFSKNPTFLPISIKTDSSKLFLRLSKYVGSTADYEEVSEIIYFDDYIEINFEPSLVKLGATVMNQPFIFFIFSEACNNIITN